jgi:hypothetical protein
MTVVIFWGIALCRAYANQCFRETYTLHLEGKKSAKQETSVQQMARQNKLSSGVPVAYGLKSDRKGIAPTLIGTLLFLTWLTR